MTEQLVALTKSAYRRLDAFMNTFSRLPLTGPQQRRSSPVLSSKNQKEDWTPHRFTPVTSLQDRRS